MTQPSEIGPSFYSAAFARHLGIFSEQEQRTLRGSRVAIAGMGGVGGIHLATLARMGIGKFSIADSDVFEAVNINRQYGADVRTLGRKKTEVMREVALFINPEADVRMSEALEGNNIDAFLEGADVAIDGIDFFAVDAKRLLFNRARDKSIPVITAGPLGFSAILLVFTPEGMGFDEYFGIHEGMTSGEKGAALAVGLSPAGLHLPYMDLSKVSLKSRSGPSVGSACALCAALAATETANILLKRQPVQAAPHYFQFDPYRKIYKKGYLFLGGKNPLQRIKRRIFLNKIRALAQRP